LTGSKRNRKSRRGWGPNKGTRWAARGRIRYLGPKPKLGGEKKKKKEKKKNVF